MPRAWPQQQNRCCLGVVLIMIRPAGRRRSGGRTHKLTQSLACGQGNGFSPPKEMTNTVVVVVDATLPKTGAVVVDIMSFAPSHRIPCEHELEEEDLKQTPAQARVLRSWKAFVRSRRPLCCALALALMLIAAGSVVLLLSCCSPWAQQWPPADGTSQADRGAPAAASWAEQQRLLARPTPLPKAASLNLT